MDYPNKKDISFIDIYDDEVATYPRAVTYTGTVSTDSQDSKVLIADSDGDGFTTNFVEFGNNVAGFEEIRKGYYLFDGTEIRKVVGVTPSAQAITLDSPFTTSYEGLPLKVIKPILLPRVTFQNTGAVDGSIYTKTSPTDQTKYGSITLKAGDGYTFDSSTLSAFVIDSTNTTVKLSNAFFFEVGASGGGGGGDYIPLSGTEVGKPVTGDIELSPSVKIKSNGVNGNLSQTFDDGELTIDATFIDGLDEYRSYISINSDQVGIYNKTPSFTHSLNVNASGISIADDNPSSRGIIANNDYSANITDLDYTQKKYVDTHIAFTTVPTSSTDTGTKGNIAVDASYLYICVDTNTWTRIALTW